MAAHQIQTLIQNEDGDYLVPPGVNLVCEIQLPSNANVNVTIVHTRPSTQDFSLRCWFSREPGGSPIEGVAPELSFWHPRRRALSLHSLRSASSPTVSEELLVYSISAPPGIYYLNVLNLVNSTNGFYLNIDTVAA